MAAPLPPIPPKALTGVQDAQSALYQRSVDGAVTVVLLEKKEGNKTYWITVQFEKPIDEDRMVSYLNEKATVDKIKHMMQQLAVFDSFGKQELRLVSYGLETHLSYKNKNNVIKKLDLSEGAWTHTRFAESNRLQKKVDEAEGAKNKSKMNKVAAKRQKFLKLMQAFEKVSKTVVVPAQPSDQAVTPQIQVSNTLPKPQPVPQTQTGQTTGPGKALQLKQQTAQQNIQNALQTMQPLQNTSGSPQQIAQSLAQAASDSAQPLAPVPASAKPKKTARKTRSKATQKSTTQKSSKSAQSGKGKPLPPVPTTHKKAPPTPPKKP